jgi:prepilin-type N-terminal cleavage/methylation domain-containing protein
MTTTITHSAPYVESPSVEQGFTLVELAIVLVIIGFIIGGLLTGQSLIQAASVRSVIKQLEQFNLGINAFKCKYNSLPGDYTGSTVDGIAVTPGDGNHYISDTNNAVTTERLSGEILNFWAHLTSENFIDGSYLGGTFPTTMTTSRLVFDSGYLPKSKLARNATWIFFSLPSGNYFQLSPISSNATRDIITTETALTPTEAYSIDSKLDDGLAASGPVTAWGANAAGGFTAAPASTLSATGCANTGGVYNQSLNAPLCSLRFNAKF